MEFLSKKMHENLDGLLYYLKHLFVLFQIP